MLVATNAPAIANTLGDLRIDISEPARAYTSAPRQAVSTADRALADADNALSETQFLIEKTTDASDEMVIDAFMTPPSDNALEVLSADSLTDVTIEQTLLDMDGTVGRRAHRAAGRLDQYEVQLEAQQTGARGRRGRPCRRRGHVRRPRVHALARRRSS